MRTLPTLLSLVALLSRAAPAAAQSLEYPRPKVDAPADTNSWETYYAEGVRRLRLQPHAAEAYFYWASQLEPQRAEPLFARWVAFHLTDIRRWVDYMDERPKVLADSEVVRHERMRYAASLRNPFVPQRLAMYLFMAEGGNIGFDAYARGWIAYARNDLRTAAVAFGSVGRREPELFWSARHLRTEMFVNLRQYDSASAELTVLRDLLEARSRERLVRAYESREMLEYSRGLLYSVRSLPDSARETFQASVVENAGFYPAHMALGDLALSAGDAPTAVTEYEQAVAIEPDDPVLQFHYGVALTGVGRYQPAAAALWWVNALLPSYAAPYLQLGHTLELAGDRVAARDAYATYVKLAPRGATDGIALARGRLAALGAPAP